MTSGRYRPWSCPSFRPQDKISCTRQWAGSSPSWKQHWQRMWSGGRVSSGWVGAGSGVGVVAGVPGPILVSYSIRTGNQAETLCRALPRGCASLFSLGPSWGRVAGTPELSFKPSQALPDQSASWGKWLWKQTALASAAALLPDAPGLFQMLLSLHPASVAAFSICGRSRLFRVSLNSIP